MAVVAVDQSLFAVVKYTQWQWVEIDDEKQIILIFGGLNLNKALWRTEGDFSWSVWLGSSPVLLKVNPLILLIWGHHLVSIFIRAQRRYEFCAEVHLEHEDVFFSNPL